MSRRSPWGIVGTGGISRTTVGDLHLTENVDLVAVASRSAANAEAFAAEFGVPRWHGDYDVLFADEDVDVVYIGTPIGTHVDVARGTTGSTSRRRSSSATPTAGSPMR